MNQPPRRELRGRGEPLLLFEGAGLQGERKTQVMGFPGGPEVKNLPAKAGDTGSIPGPGTKIPHAVEQLRPDSTTTEPGSHSC